MSSVVRFYALFGRSLEMALHAMVSSIEGSLGNKKHTLVAFLDIESAFNNVITDAIIKAELRNDETTNSRSFLLIDIARKHIELYSSIRR